MYLEGITVCVNYADFLAWTLPAAVHQFDRLVVVTTPEDKATQRLCEFHRVECVQTHVFYENGARFNKAKGINEGLKRLSKKGWVLHFDSDIYLPPQFRSTIHPLNLDPHYLYGFDRLMCHSFREWYAFWQAPDQLQENGIYVHADNPHFKVGTRVAYYGNPEGYIPIGFGQLWNVPASGVDFYPDEHTDAGRSDMLFAKQWHRNRRGFIPEVLTIHLESEKMPSMGANWGGRTTCPFGPNEQVAPELATPLPTLPTPPSKTGYDGAALATIGLLLLAKVVLWGIKTALT